MFGITSLRICQNLVQYAIIIGSIYKKYFYQNSKRSRPYNFFYDTAPLTISYVRIPIWVVGKIRTYSIIHGTKTVGKRRRVLGYVTWHTRIYQVGYYNCMFRIGAAHSQKLSPTTHDHTPSFAWNSTFQVSIGCTRNQSHP